MKRFFCTICQRVKRVRKFPRHIESRDSITPVNRVGVCNRHETSFENASRKAVK